jgi:hypothetical protein
MSADEILAWFSRNGGKVAPAYLTQYLQASPAMIDSMIADGRVAKDSFGLIYLPQN